MREECKHFQSRTYASGEVARLCILDLAPEAPWRCPENCAAYERRLADSGWTHGDLIEPPIEKEPEGENIAELLDEAEDIVNAVTDEVRGEVAAENAKREDRGLGRWLRRRGPRSGQ